MRIPTILAALLVLLLLALVVSGAGLVIDNQASSIGAATSSGTAGPLSSAGYAGSFVVSTAATTGRATWTTALANTSYVLVLSPIDTAPNSAQYYLTRETTGCTVTWTVSPNPGAPLTFAYAVVSY